MNSYEMEALRRSNQTSYVRDFLKGLVMFSLSLFLLMCSYTLMKEGWPSLSIEVIDECCEIQECVDESRDADVTPNPDTPTPTSTSAPSGTPTATSTGVVPDPSPSSIPTDVPKPTATERPTDIPPEPTIKPGCNCGLGNLAEGCDPNPNACGKKTGETNE